MKSHLQRMLRFSIWADTITLQSLQACPAAHDEALTLLSHILAAQHVWLSRILGREPPYPVWPQLTLAECETLASMNAHEYSTFLDNVSEADLERLIHYHNAAGDSFTTSVIDILTQVLTHGPYHRGQIAKILGRAGKPAVSTDYITYVRSLPTATS